MIIFLGVQQTYQLEVVSYATAEIVNTEFNLIFLKD